METPRQGGSAERTWAARMAEALLAAYADVPAAVLDRAALHLLDSLGCAAGANDAAPVVVTRAAVSESHPPQATLLFSGERATVDDAVLVNGAAVRYLDANDIFIGAGPGGHPSDNIPVALAVAEHSGASGRDLLASIAVAYELTWRLRTHVFRPSPRGGDWHEISISGPVAAAMTALLRGADSGTLATALCIAAAKSYALKEIRRGQISMLKACGNALVARDGVLAARLALAGMTGPARVFEGSSGLVATFGGTPTPEIADALCAPPEWVIRRASIKPYPGLGTSQAAITAAVLVFGRAGRVEPSEVREIRLVLPDTPWAHDYARLDERRAPRTRETADHSIHFLVALALRHGEVTQTHYDTERWLDPDIRELIDKTVVSFDSNLDLSSTFPATVEVALADGRVVGEQVVDTPGSPRAPWGREEILEKFARLDRSGVTDESRGAIADAVTALPTAPDVQQLMNLLGSVASSRHATVSSS